MSEYIIRIDNPITFPYLHQEIVRCRDCRHSSREYKDYLYCYRMGAYKEFFVEPDGFCAWGERKEGGE